MSGQGLTVTESAWLWCCTWCKAKVPRGMLLSLKVWKLLLPSTLGSSQLPLVNCLWVLRQPPPMDPLLWGCLGKIAVPLEILCFLKHLYTLRALPQLLADKNLTWNVQTPGNHRIRQPKSLHEIPEIAERFSPFFSVPWFRS